MDIANLNIKVTSQGPKQALDDVRAIGKAGTDATKNVSALNAAFTKGATQSAQFRQQVVTGSQAIQRSMLEAQRATNLLLADMLRLQKATQDATKPPPGINQTKGAIGELWGMVRGLIGGYLALKAVKMADEFKNLEGRIKLATNSNAEFKKSFDALIAISSKTGTALEGPVSIFQRISQNRADLGASNEQILQFTDTVAKLGVVSGASGDALRFGLTQLGQSLSSSILRAEEFNSIMENIPGIGKAIAEQMGITTGQLRNLVINGQVLSKDVFTAILNSSKEANGQFEQFPKTVGMAFRGAVNDIMVMIGSIDKTTGASNGLRAAIVFISGAIQALGTGFKAVFTGIQQIMLTVAGSITALINSILHGINLAISGLNKIPGVNIGEINTAGIDGIQDSIKQALTQSFTDSLAMVRNDTANIAGTAPAAAANDSGGGKLSKDYVALAKKYGGGTQKKGKGDSAVNTFEADQKTAIRALQEEIDGIGKTKVELDRLKVARDFDNEASKVSLKLSGDKRQAFLKTAEGLKAERLMLFDLLEQQKRTFGTGAITALNEYADAASNTADQVHDVFSDGLKGVEDAFVDLATTGKASFTDLANSILKDIIRIQVQQSIVGPASSLLSSALQTGFGMIASSFSGVYSPGTGGYNPAKLAPPSKPAFATGGSFSVGGFGGTDSQLVSFKATPGEIVNVQNGSSGANNGGGGQPIIIQNMDLRGAGAGVGDEVKKAIADLNRSIEPRALNAVENKMKRDPGFAKRG